MAMSTSSCKSGSRKNPQGIENFLADFPPTGPTMNALNNPPILRMTETFPETLTAVTNAVSRSLSDLPQGRITNNCKQHKLDETQIPCSILKERHGRGTDTFPQSNKLVTFDDSPVNETTPCSKAYTKRRPELVAFPISIRMLPTRRGLQLDVKASASGLQLVVVL